MASRDYLSKASHTLSGLGTCCTARMDELWAEQKYLEGLAWQARYNRQEGLGVLPAAVWAVIALGGSLAAWLGTQVYTHYAESKTSSDYLDCYKRVFDLYKANNYNDTIASQEASNACKAKPTPNGAGESILGVVKLAVYASIGIAAFYLVVKLIKD